MLESRTVLKHSYSTSGDVYTAYQVGTNGTVAIKQIDLGEHPKIRKDSIINEIHVMKASRHPNFVNYIDSFLYKNGVWVVMEYMEGGSLTDVVTANFMSEGQIAAASREICQGLDHLHRHGVIHRDIKSGNVLLSTNGDIKLSMPHLSYHSRFICSQLGLSSGPRILCTDSRGKCQAYGVGRNGRYALLGDSRVCE